MVPFVIERAWDFAWERLFCEKTGLFYDYLVSDRPDAAVFHLPTPEEIALQIPNPCGWGTGMEDSMLFGGSMLDAVVARYEALGEEEMRSLADRVFRGMLRCADAGKDGFLPRSLSPADGRSHYIESSRDQYTHWAYGAWRLYRSKLSDECQRAQIRRVLTGFARRAERNVREETGWDFLREDGGRTLVSRMWGELSVHEYLRLPMLYAAAWRTTGDLHWKEMYEAYRAEAIEKTGALREKNWWNCYGALQLQCSLRLLYEAEEDAAYRQRYAEMMRAVSDLYLPDAPAGADFICSGEYDRRLLYYEYRPWRKVNARWIGLTDGYGYYNPGQSELPENKGFYDLRSLGEIVSIHAMVPGRRVEDKQLHALERAAEIVDFSRIGNYSPALLACGYCLALENRMKNR